MADEDAATERLTSALLLAPPPQPPERWRQVSDMYLAGKHASVEARFVWTGVKNSSQRDWIRAVQRDVARLWPQVNLEGKDNTIKGWATKRSKEFATAALLAAHPHQGVGADPLAELISDLLTP